MEAYLANTEVYGIYLLLGGAFLLAVGALWLVISGFREHVAWGLALIVVWPLAFIAYLVLHFRKAWFPAALTMLGGLLICTAFLAPILHLKLYGLTAWERVVDGEVHLTLTGWDKPATDYAKLAERDDIVVLQMANEDVTDDTLHHLKNLTRLRELDLERTQITDEGLKSLKDLPALEDLRLRKTKITDAGFRESLLPLKNLKNLDVRDTEVASKTMREWKKADPENRKYLAK
jgi:hypothetical protein